MSFFGLSFPVRPFLLDVSCRDNITGIEGQYNQYKPEVVLSAPQSAFMQRDSGGACARVSIYCRTCLLVCVSANVYGCIAHVCVCVHMYMPGIHTCHCVLTLHVCKKSFDLRLARLLVGDLTLIALCGLL